MKLLRPLTFAFLLALPTAALADEPRVRPLPAPVAGPATVFTFGRENPDCGEWTDACHVCTRAADGTPQCSTPGIACTPSVPVCRTRKAP
jgi:hypothetical protein